MMQKLRTKWKEMGFTKFTLQSHVLQHSAPLPSEVSLFTIKNGFLHNYAIAGDNKCFNTLREIVISVKFFKQVCEVGVLSSVL